MEGTASKDTYPGKFTPQIVYLSGRQALFTMLVVAERCPTCGLWMLRARDPFPPFMELTLQEQARRAILHLASDARDHEGHRICLECKGDGKASIRCELCELEMPSSEAQWSTGDPAVYLCKGCFETVPAKRWVEKRDRLLEEHRYDLE